MAIEVRAEVDLPHPSPPLGKGRAGVIPRNKYTLGCGFTYGRLPPDGRLTPTPTAPLNHRGLSEVVGAALPLAITRLMGIFFIGNHLISLVWQ
jgi:hypothetical protein